MMTIILNFVKEMKLFFVPLTELNVADKLPNQHQSLP